MESVCGSSEGRRRVIEKRLRARALRGCKKRLYANKEGGSDKEGHEKPYFVEKGWAKTRCKKGRP